MADSLSDASEEQTDPQQVRDDITGQLVPADETIELYGYRVGAEGKQILLERQQSGQPLGGEPERPSVWRRLGCAILDSLLLGAVNVILMVVLGGVLFALFVGSGSGSPSGPAQAAWFQFGNGLVNMLAAAISLAYFAVLHARDGQTLGKKAGKLKVVNRDLSDISARTAFWRSVLFAGPQALPAVVLLFVLLAPGPIMMILPIINIAVFVYALANVITALADTHQQRAIHDRLVGTRVVRMET
jgi:uncharacterized RDD family membrane protein YckC